MTNFTVKDVFRSDKFKSKSSEIMAFVILGIVAVFFELVLLILELVGYQLTINGLAINFLVGSIVNAALLAFCFICLLYYLFKQKKYKEKIKLILSGGTEIKAKVIGIQKRSLKKNQPEVASINYEFEYDGNKINKKSAYIFNARFLYNVSELGYLHIVYDPADDDVVYLETKKTR